MSYRCINNLSGYCYREPNVPEAEKAYLEKLDGHNLEVHGLSPGACLNNWQSCSAFVTWSQECHRLLVTPGG